MHGCNKLSRRSRDDRKKYNLKQNLKEDDGTKSAALAMRAYKGMWELDQERESYGSIAADADSRFAFFISFTKSRNSSLVMWVQVRSVGAYLKKGVSISSALTTISLPIVVYILILIQDGSSPRDMFFWLHTEKQQSEDRLHFLMAELLCASSPEQTHLQVFITVSFLCKMPLIYTKHSTVISLKTRSFLPAVTFMLIQWPENTNLKGT